MFSVVPSCHGPSLSRKRIGAVMGYRDERRCALLFAKSTTTTHYESWHAAQQFAESTERISRGYLRQDAEKVLKYRDLRGGRVLCHTPW